MNISFQIHWNNPEELDQYTDSSGLQIYYTPKLRPNDAGMLLVGQERLVIPPGRQGVVFDSVCSSRCTSELLRGPVHITRAINHMHYLGNDGSVIIQACSDAYILTDKRRIHSIYVKLFNS